jgi:mRNA-degrading endonuclease YafQ of YafQ-DinJ toxin-antitoxin module
MFVAEFSDGFKKQYKKLIKNNKIIEKRIDVSLAKLLANPEAVSHKVGDVWSCRVTGDIRVIWEYSGGELTLLLIKIGGHSGGNNVYK